jgi:hypothetical protein
MLAPQTRLTNVTNFNYLSLIRRTVGDDEKSFIPLTPGSCEEVPQPRRPKGHFKSGIPSGTQLVPGHFVNLPLRHPLNRPNQPKC